MKLFSMLAVLSLLAFMPGAKAYPVALDGVTPIYELQLEYGCAKVRRYAKPTPAYSPYPEWKKFSRMCDIFEKLREGGKTYKVLPKGLRAILSLRRDYASMLVDFFNAWEPVVQKYGTAVGSGWHSGHVVSRMVFTEEYVSKKRTIRGTTEDYHMPLVTFVHRITHSFRGVAIF